MKVGGAAQKVGKLYSLNSYSLYNRKKVWLRWLYPTIFNRIWLLPSTWAASSLVSVCITQSWVGLMELSSGFQQCGAGAAGIDTQGADSKTKRLDPFAFQANWHWAQVEYLLFLSSKLAVSSSLKLSICWIKLSTWSWVCVHLGTWTITICLDITDIKMTMDIYVYIMVYSIILLICRSNVNHKLDHNIHYFPFIHIDHKQQKVFMWGKDSEFEVIFWFFKFLSISQSIPI